MTTITQQTTESSDSALLNLLNESGTLGINDLAAALDVTPTAVRQRLSRLMGQGLIARKSTPAGRGRPSHFYSLTVQGRRKTGTNFTDLTLALWQELRSIKDPEVRNGLLKRLAGTMAAMYAPRVQGKSVIERMGSLVELLAERGVKFRVEKKEGELPILAAHSCPYPELAEQDRAICAVEKMLFDQLLGGGVKLTDCRLDGASCCRFETQQPTGILTDSLSGSGT